MSRAHCGAIQKAKWKVYYGAQPLRTETNKKRSIKRHIRRYPEDEKAKADFTKRYGIDALKSILDKPLRRTVRRAKRKGKKKTA